MHQITQAPIPRIRHLISSLFLRADYYLSDSWVQGDEIPFWFSRSAYSLAFIAKCRQKVAKRDSITVWIPDFFCNSSLQPLRAAGVELIFYPISNLSTPDYEACDILAENKSVDIFLHVHYLGQPLPADLSSDFAKKHSAWLVEDAAHIFSPVEGVGEMGDCVMYSPHKHLPIPNGAILLLKMDGPSCFGDDDRCKLLFKENIDDYINSNSAKSHKSLKWLVKRIVQRLGFRSRKRIPQFQPKSSDMADLGPAGMSSLAKKLLFLLIPNLSAIKAKRCLIKDNWKETLLWSSSGLLKSLSLVETTPYLAGFYSDTQIKMKKNFDWLGSEDVKLPVTTWPDLPPEVLGKKDFFYNAIAFSQDRFYLPVHQSVSQKEIVKCGLRVLKVSTKNWQIHKLSQEEWDVQWGYCMKANLMQSWQYGEAKLCVEGWKPVRLLVSDDQKNPIALVQVLTRMLPIFGGIARINRGPIMINSKSEEDNIGLIFAVLKLVLKEARHSRWWYIQTALELSDSNAARAGLKALGFRNFKSPSWASGFISLQNNEENILMSLNGKWRNGMRKGLKLGVNVSKKACGEAELAQLLTEYSKLQNSRGFVGVSGDLLKAMAHQIGSAWEFNLFFAYAGGEDKSLPVGMLVTIRTGDTAIYLIGSTNRIGRDLQANSVLLWESLLDAKCSGCDWYDIGGLSNSTPKGVASFKKGLNAILYENVGEYYKLISPISFKSNI
ncbi:peptidoglycan bridge formation glycyltransferase FemA/FemB family protein [Amylibacter sp.]|nr:peptidoglycan bridge formation glycyltransferase FemA/FemB family protein [Amylibacter sp.]